MEMFCQHKTPKYVVLRSWKLGFIRYSLQLFIIFYVFVYQLYLKRGYQARDNVVGWASTKVTGTAYAGEGDSIEIWDAVDAVYPPKEPGALFITTNYVRSPLQSRGQCTGNDPRTEACSSNCTAMKSTKNGVGAGMCSDDHKFCSLHAWCPVMNDSMVPSNVLKGLGEFAVKIRLDVKFPRFGIEKSNMNGTRMTPGLNMFTLQDMLQAANSTLDEISSYGSVITVDINWDCDLDADLSLCNPTFTFVRLDDLLADSSAARGFWFKYAHHYYTRGGNLTNPTVQHTRDLYKVWGARFIFVVSGSGSKFDLPTCLINIGAGIALLTLSVIVADFVALHFLANARFYRQAKYEEVKNF